MIQPNSPRYVTCPCQLCSGHIEFEPSHAGETVACPHCKMDTMLFIPTSSNVIVERTKPIESKPAPVSPKNSTVRRSVQPLIAWGCAVFFALSSILFAFRYLSEKKSLQKTEIALAMTEKSEAKLKSSVQAVETVAKDNVSELASELVPALSGIYLRNGRSIGMDLRSDGTAYNCFESGQIISNSKRQWKTDGDTVTVATSQFKIEGSDLIDAQGNRWLHLR